MPENREYKAVQRWCGWLGGFGNNDDVAGFMALQTQGGVEVGEGGIWTLRVVLVCSPLEGSVYLRAVAVIE